MSDLKTGLGASATEKRTLVEEGTTFKGSLSSTCPILVKGTINGDIEAPSLTVASSGAVSGKVKAGELKSDGELSGEFDVDKVQLSGSVKDNTVLRAKSLEVKLAVTGAKMQVIFGECALEVGDAPTNAKSEGRPESKETNGKSVPPPAES
jgi:cytoskeletal protein CcmA (bactofilin family)